MTKLKQVGRDCIVLNTVENVLGSCVKNLETVNRGKNMIMARRIKNENSN